MHHKRKREEWPVLVYKYGARLDDRACFERWPDALRQTVMAQRDLWNQLVGLFQVNRTAYDGLMAAQTDLDPLREQVMAAETALQALVTVDKQARQRARRRAYDGVATQQAAITVARQQLQDARGHLKAAQAVVRDTLRPQLRALLERLWQDTDAAMKAAPLLWPNAECVAHTFRTTVEMFLKRQGGMPQPHTYIDRVNLCYRFAGRDLTWEQLCGGATAMASLAPIDEIYFQRPRPAGWRQGIRTTGHICLAMAVGDDGRAQRVDLPFRVSVPRRPPAGSVIKKVALIGREMVRAFGPYRSRWDWEFHVTVEVPPPAQRHAVRQVALDMNWRVHEDTVRVVVASAGPEHTEAYMLPSRIVRQWRYTMMLQQEIDTGLEECKLDLQKLWRDMPLPPDVLPDMAAWTHMRQQGLQRLLRVVDALPEIVPSRQRTLDVLKRWQGRAARLWREKRGLENRLHRAKIDWYNMVANDLCARYDVIAVEALALKVMGQRRTDQEPRLQAGAKYRHLVGVGHLVTRILHTAAREGVRVVQVDPAYTTLTCHICGAVLTAQDGAQYLTCPQGHAWDQDVNAAQILYARAFTEPSVVTSVGAE